MIKQIVKLSAGVGASLLLMGSVASAGSITNTGPWSVNKIKGKHVIKCTVVNKNNVVIGNATVQTSNTGKAKVVWNNTGGDAASGSATNANGTALAVDVANLPGDVCSCGCDEVQVDANNTINQTGLGSWNVISWKSVNKTKVVNVNNVGVSNATIQTANSGNASVVGNTTGGNATSGNASNTNSSSFTVTVSNN